MIPIDNFPVPIRIYLSKYSGRSLSTMVRAAELACKALHPGTPPADLDLGTVTASQIIAARDRLVAGFAPATARKLISVLKNLLLEAAVSGLLDQPAAAATALALSHGMPPEPPRRPTRPLSDRELAAIADACTAAGDWRGDRDRAVVTIAARLGLSLADIVALDLANLDVASGRVIARRGRLAPRLDPVADELGVWLDRRGPLPGPLFTATQPAHRHAPVGRRLSEAGARLAVARRAAEAGLADFEVQRLRATAEAHRNTVLLASRESAWAAAAAVDVPVQPVRRDLQPLRGGDTTQNCPKIGNSWQVIDNPDTRAERDNGEEVER